MKQGFRAEVLSTGVAITAGSADVTWAERV